MTGHAGLTLATDGGGQITLGEELGTGVEGTVWSVSGQPETAAKLFHGGKATPRTRAKLICMLRERPAITRCPAYRIAWPESRLRQNEKNRTIVGYTMPRLDGARYREIGAFLNQARRKLRVERRNRPYTTVHMVTLARNAADLVAAIHREGHVIGDLSSRNLWADDRCQVALIDCDSMQVSDPEKGELHHCYVGTPEYTAPERQGVPFGEIPRTKDDDRFALGVLIYQLLFQGRHPFAGIYHGEQSGPEQTAIAQRIHTGRFIHSGEDGNYQATKPAATVWRSLPFKKQLKAALLHEGERYDAERWVSDIEKAAERLKQCPAKETHQYFGSGGCTWCRFKRMTGTEPFPSVGEAGGRPGKRRSR